ncbi:MAG TPA: thiolase family protein [Desulfosalsimonadaceae bacterium]|nr:thiolase family protein [Desulfosalsimonadaceae bacterium]
MSRRVAVCATAQIKNEPDIWYKRFQGMLLDCFESILSQTGVTFDMEKGIRNVVTCSDDVLDARTISDNGMTDVVGAHFRGEEKTAQDGINALGYAMAAILSGHDDLVLVMGHCKESQPESRQMCTNLAFDPFYCRPLGLDFLNASAFQARAYMEKSRITEEQLAKVVVRSRRMGAKNPYARENEPVTEEAVMQSPLMSDPIRELHTYPRTDWAVGLLLCCEERAHEFTDNPVWITGFGSCMDSYFLGDRDLSANFALKQAASRAYDMAGIKDPKSEFDVVELNDAYAYQLPMWAEGAGLAEEAGGGRWIDDGGLEAAHVNTSGGMLNGNPIMLGGLARALEGVHQLKGSAGDRQVDGAKKALAHGTTGAAGQHHGVLILEK